MTDENDTAESDTRLDTAPIEDAAVAVRELGEALRDFKAKKERRDEYFWKAFPHIWGDEELKQATIRREERR